MERWRSSWRTLYPSSEEKIRKVLEAIETYKFAMEIQYDALEKEKPTNVGEAMTIKIMKLKTMEVLDLMDNWKEKIEELMKEKTPDEVIEIIGHWIEFEKSAWNDYVSAFAKELERIIKGEK